MYPSMTLNTRADNVVSLTRAGSATTDDADVLTGPRNVSDATEDVPLSLPEFTDIFWELENQPAWRYDADREMDYVDGNQLSAEILRKQASIGMPPAIEPLIGPAIESVLGLEAKNRADWRVKPSSESTNPELARAMGAELNQAERKSKADRACSAAFRDQVCVGVGWVEVSRNPNPFEYPYRCMRIPRNEIWWDWLSQDDDLRDARYLVRRRWTAAGQAKLMFPKKRDLIDRCMGGWGAFDALNGLEGGRSTDLARSYADEQSWSIEELEWRDAVGKRVCLFEVWYRRWVQMLVLKSPDGRVVEYDPKNQMHLLAVATGRIMPEYAIVPKMRVSIWMGPHRMVDSPTPYRHQDFPYVPFWGKREDRTLKPYGLVRGMIFMQDNVNATTSKLRWGLASVRTIRTKGATNLTDQQLRQEIARPDADIVLNDEHMAKQGARFEVERDFQLNQQQFQLMQDGRAGILRVAGITPALAGQTGNATSGVQESTQLEQSTQALADMFDNFADARANVGERLLSLITEDLIGKEKAITVPGHGIKDDEVVNINMPGQDIDGFKYLDNDIERAMLTVDVNDVPSTSSYRAQQLAAMSEAFKSMPPQFQNVAMPYLVALMDLPMDTRDQIIADVRAAAKMPTPEEIEQRIAAAVKDSRMQDMRDLKVMELRTKNNPDLLRAQIENLEAKTFETNVNAMYGANQTAAAIVMNPAIAPVADNVAQLSGYNTPTPVGISPNLVAPATTAAAQVTPEAQAIEHARTNPEASTGQEGMAPGGQSNTDPVFPGRPPKPASALQGPGAGSETLRTSDNQPTEE